jgi:hypothetical protein
MNLGRKHENINKYIHMYIELNVLYNIHIALSFTFKVIICIQIIN